MLSRVAFTMTFAAAVWMGRLPVMSAAGFPKTVYVNEFQSQSLRDANLLNSFTIQFETALTKTGVFTVVDRRNLGRSLQQCKAESLIGSLDQLSANARDCLRKALNADAMIFGVVINNAESNDIVITATSPQRSRALI